MTFWQFWNARAERRAARRQELMNRGLDVRSLAKLTFEALDAKLLIAVAVIGLFAWAFGENPEDETIKGALIGAFAGAWGYYLGSSNTASRANDRADAAVDLSAKALEKVPAPPAADIELSPGESKTIKAD